MNIFNLNQYKGHIILLAAFIIAIIFIIISAKNELTAMENILFQIFIFTGTIWGSFISGQISKQNEEIKEIRPIARRAFRRVLSIYKGISRIAMTIDEEKNKSDKSKEQILDIIQEIAIGQIYSANDAIEEWKDIIPDDVNEILKTRMAKRNIDSNEKGWNTNEG